MLPQSLSPLKWESRGNLHWNGVCDFAPCMERGRDIIECRQIQVHSKMYLKSVVYHDESFDLECQQLFSKGCVA